MAQSRQGTINWDAIELAYRAGYKTNSQLAREYGITQQAISYQIKKKGWTRDLGDAVKARTAEKLDEVLIIKNININPIENMSVEQIIDEIIQPKQTDPSSNTYLLSNELSYKEKEQLLVSDAADIRTRFWFDEHESITKLNDMAKRLEGDLMRSIKLNDQFADISLPVLEFQIRLHGMVTATRGKILDLYRRNLAIFDKTSAMPSDGTTEDKSPYSEPISVYIERTLERVRERVEYVR